MRYCPACGNEVIDGHRCPACNSPLSDTPPFRALIILGPDEWEDTGEDPNDLLEDFDRRLP